MTIEERTERFMEAIDGHGTLNLTVRELLDVTKQLVARLRIAEAKVKEQADIEWLRMIAEMTGEGEM